MTSEIEVPVLIVGGSLVGMTSALLLGHHGVKSLAVEYHRGTAIHPRAAQCTQRTLEIFREVGIERPVCERSAEQFVQDGGIVAVETLAGGLTQHFIADLNAGVRDVSPCERVFLSQNALEPMLKQRAEELGARFVFATEVTGIEQNADGVVARLRHRDSGAETRVRARYAIAADGAHSRMRQGLAVGMRGHPTFSRSVTIYFRANLRKFLEREKWAVVYVNNDRLRGFFRFEKPFDSGFLVVSTTGDAAHPNVDVSSTLTNERAVELVQLALGSRDIAVSVDNVMNWNATAEWSEKMQRGRVFIAGDAAHVMPPTGGFGGNTGVVDAHNLAWKLAFVLSGRAAPALLETYEPERTPVAEYTCEQAYTRYVLRTDPTLGMANTQKPVGELNIELGHIYRSPAIVTEEPDDGAQHVNPRESFGRPGTRAPHLWLTRAGERVSTLDLFGKRFVLLGGADSAAWCEAATAAGAARGLQIDTWRAGEAGLVDAENQLARAYGIEASGAVLVRPDGVVAWRARSGAGASAAVLQRVLRQILG